MQRIFNVNQWTVIQPGEALPFPAERPRLVRLEVNAADACALYLLDSNGEAFFLARVQGRDTIEFVSPGAYSLSVDGGACSVYTVDGSNIAHTVEAPVSFTKIVERRRRSPEIEYIAALMSQNMERRLAQQANELSAQFERRERERTARAAAQAAPVGVPANAGTEPAPAAPGNDSAGAPDPAA